MAVAVVGLYPITPLGEGPETLYDALISSSPEIPPASAKLDINLSEYTDSKHAYLDPTIKLSLACACGAADSAGWSSTGAGIGLSLGTAFGCRTSLNKHSDTVTTKGGRLNSPLVFSHAYPNSANSVISIGLRLEEFNTCIVSGSTAGAVAVGCAFDQIILGRHHRVLAGGADAPGIPTITPGGCILALQDDRSAIEQGRESLALLLGWHCGHASPPDVASSACSQAGLSLQDMDGTTGNVDIGLPHLNFDSIHGTGAAAAAVLDIASLCLLASRGWGALPPLAKGVVLRKDASGLCCALVIEL